jgi:hypothetical protein
MAGLTWFELDTDFHDSPKVKALCSRLRQPLADSYVSRLYAYCYRHATDRFPPESAPDTIEDIARWKGRRGVLFDALFAVEVLERDAGRVVVHGVAERLGPHLAKKLGDAERQKRHREKVTASIGRNAGSNGPVTRDVTRESQGNQDKDIDRDKDQEVSETASQSEAPPWLAGVRAKLAQEFGRSEPLGIGKDPARVVASFARWVEAVGEDFTVSDCARVARDKNAVPANLAWWPGWLDTVSDAQLHRWRSQGVGA